MNMVKKPSYLTPSDLLKEKSEYHLQQPFKLSAIYLTRNFLCRVVTVLTTPTLIHDAVRSQNIMITNPSPSGFAGGLLSATGLITAQVGAGPGNSQAAPLGVANYLNMHLGLHITAIGAGTTWSFYNMVQDPISLLWMDSTPLAIGVNPAIVAGWTNNCLYGYLGQLGVGTNYAVRWTLDAGAGAISFTLSYTLKQGMIGSPLGISQVVWIGSSSGVSVVSGYPILESSEKVFVVAEGVHIWSIAQTTVPIRIFELT